jgi:hypothetical protein
VPPNFSGGHQGSRTAAVPATVAVVRDPLVAPTIRDAATLFFIAQRRGSPLLCRLLPRVASRIVGGTRGHVLPPPSPVPQQFVTPGAHAGIRRHKAVKTMRRYLCLSHLYVCARWCVSDVVVYGMLSHIRIFCAPESTNLALVLREHGYRLLVLPGPHTSYCTGLSLPLSHFLCLTLSRKR